MSEEKEYQKRFNQGYFIAKHAPEFKDLFEKAYGKSDDLEGIKDGIKEYEIDETLDLTPDWLKDNPKEYPDNNQSKEKGIEPEI